VRASATSKARQLYPNLPLGGAGQGRIGASVATPRMQKGEKEYLIAALLWSISLVKFSG
jgi:hypothetical protein